MKIRTLKRSILIQMSVLMTESMVDQDIIHLEIQLFFVSGCKDNKKYIDVLTGG